MTVHRVLLTVLALLSLLPAAVQAQEAVDEASAGIADVIEDARQQAGDVSDAAEAAPTEGTDDAAETDSPETEAVDRPDWVVLFDAGKIGEIAGSDSYFGVGYSTVSQQEADQMARLEFARNVETRVESRIEEAATAREGTEDYSFEMTTEIRTELSLKGVAVTALWREGENGPFYSLIEMTREAYTALLEQNIREELALQELRMEEERSRLEREREEQRLAAEAEQARLEQEQHEEELARREREHLIRKYESFLETPAPAAFIDFRSAALDAAFQRYSLSLGIAPGIAPFDAVSLLESLSLGYTFWQFMEISALTRFETREETFGWAYQDIGIKLRLLNGAGDLVKVSLALGGRAYVVDLHNLVVEGAASGQGASFTGSVIVSFPMLLYTHLALEAGLDRLSLGVQSHPLFAVLGDSLGLIGEVHYFIDSRLRRPGFSSSWLFQAGVRFKLGDTFSSTLAWKDHSDVILGFQICL